MHLAQWHGRILITQQLKPKAICKMRPLRWCDGWMHVDRAGDGPAIAQGRLARRPAGEAASHPMRLHSFAMQLNSFASSATYHHGSTPCQDGSLAAQALAK